MKILVCIGHVPDTTSKIKFTNNNKDFDTAGVQFVIGPYEELGLTRILELKDNKVKDAVVTVINVGKADTEPTLRKALAMGADNAIRVDALPTDAYFVARQIAEVAKAEKFDLIVTGKESIEYNSGLVGGMIAEILDAAFVSSCSHFDIEAGKLIMEREIDGGREIINASMPCVVTAQRGFAIEPRIPNMRGIMAARTKPLKVVAAAGNDQHVKTVKHELPKAKAGCKYVPADNVEELVRLLHEEAKAI